MRIAGIMSGTSLDGIDVAVVDVSGKNVRTVAHGVEAWQPGMRERILAVSNAACHTRDISRLNVELGEAYAAAVIALCARSEVALESIELVGSHGQTIYHEGEGAVRNTMQIGEASVIAERVGAPVVSDFRPRDMAAGGHGAPLVPFVDYMLFGGGKWNRVALNIGGIANISVLKKRGAKEDVTAFDTGPGNMVIDQLVERYTKGRQHFDADGALAASGKIEKTLLDSLLADPWFRLKPPKSAGREQYGAEFVKKIAASGKSQVDQIATATAFTAATIALAVRKFAPGTDEIVASGGGVSNRQMMGQLAAFLPKCRIVTTAQYGIDPNAKEAIAFAVLAHRTWKNKTGNMPGATGAKRAVVLGKITR